MTTIKLPYPISANRYWRSTGRTYLSAEAIKFKRDTKILCLEQGIVAEKQCVSVTITIHPRANKNGSASKTVLDIDNAVKVTLDALKFVAFQDDADVKELAVRYGHPEKNGAVTVKVDQWQQDQ